MGRECKVGKGIIFYVYSEAGGMFGFRFMLDSCWELHTSGEIGDDFFVYVVHIPVAG